MMKFLKFYLQLLPISRLNSTSTYEIQGFLLIYAYKSGMKTAMRGYAKAM